MRVSDIYFSLRFARGNRTRRRQRRKNKTHRDWGRVEVRRLVVVVVVVVDGVLLRLLLLFLRLLLGRLDLLAGRLVVRRRRVRGLGEEESGGRY